MVKGNSVPKLGLEVGGGGVVGHVGLFLLGGFADRLGVGKTLSEVFEPSGAGVVHDRGTLLVHTMLMLAGGGEACTDIEFLRAEAGLFGVVGSAPTLYRTMRGIGDDTRAGLAEAMGMVRQKVWDRLANTTTVVLDIDSSIHEVHSENKQGTAATYKGTFGFHPIYCFSDYTGECLAVRLRSGNAAANNIADHVEVLDGAVGALPERIGVGHVPGDDPGVGEAGGEGFGLTRLPDRRSLPGAGCVMSAFSFVARGANQIQDAIGRVAIDDPRWEAAIPPGSEQSGPARKCGVGGVEITHNGWCPMGGVRFFVVHCTWVARWAGGGSDPVEIWRVERLSKDLSACPRSGGRVLARSGHDLVGALACQHLECIVCRF